MQIDVTGVPVQPGGPISIGGGQTWYWQFWYRDLTPIGGTTSNFTNAVCIDFL